MSEILAGRVALVTGGSRGIGRGIALELARCGARVVFTYHSQAGAAEETQKRVEALGGWARALRLDVEDLAAVTDGVAEIIKEHGRLDIVVNNFEEPVSIYRNHAQQRAIKVRLKGIRSNRNGIGARVELKTATGIQVRYLGLTHGYMSSSDPVIHFDWGTRRRQNG